MATDEVSLNGSPTVSRDHRGVMQFGALGLHSTRRLSWRCPMRRRALAIEDRLVEAENGDRDQDSR